MNLRQYTFLADENVHIGETIPIIIDIFLPKITPVTLEPLEPLELL